MRASGCRRSATWARGPASRPRPARRSPIPRTNGTFSSATARRVAFAGQRGWVQAIALLQQILRDDPEMADVWSQLAAFATRIDRHDLAVDGLPALHRVEARGAGRLHRRGRKPGPGCGSSTRRAIKRRRAADVAPKTDHRSRASAHEMLARIALLRHDAETAREEAVLAREDDPTLPLPVYVEGRILYDQGQYADALPLFHGRNRRAQEVRRRADRGAAFPSGPTRWRGSSGTRRRNRSSSRS